MIVYPKEIIISSLRDFFSNDTLYHYNRDQYGFANTVESNWITSWRWDA